jgi:hypothetical protein
MPRLACCICYLFFLSPDFLSSAARAAEENGSGTTIPELRSAPPVQRLHPATGLPVISLAAFEPTKWLAPFDWRPRVESSYLSLTDARLSTLASSVDGASTSIDVKAVAPPLSVTSENEGPVRPLPVPSSIQLVGPVDDGLLDRGRDSFTAIQLDLSGGPLNK